MLCKPMAPTEQTARKKSIPRSLECIENTFPECRPRKTNNQMLFNLSSPKPGHTTSGSGRGARRGGGAGSGRTGCQQICSPKGQASLVPSKASWTCRLNVSPEARTSEILFKPMEEQSPRLARG